MGKKGNIKKIFVILLAVLLVFTSLPTSVAAVVNPEFRVRNNNGPGGDYGKLVVTYNGTTVTLDAGDSHTFTYSASGGDVKIDFVPDAGYSFKYYVIGNGAQHYNNDPSYIDPTPYAGANGANDRIDINAKWEVEALQAYTVTWVNYDSSLLEKDVNVTEGTYPSYDSATPTRPATAQYVYTFNGWSPSLSPVTGNITYTAQYTQKEITYYTVTWVNYNGTQLEKDVNVPYGATPSYDGATPTRPATAQYTYTFKGWTPTISPVTKNITYTAQYTSTTRAYTVTWVNYNGTQLEKDLNVPYGTTPSYDGSTPIKPYANGVSYIFAGWTPAISPVTGNITYTATYTETTNTYTVTWVDYNGTQLEKDVKVPYGATPSYDGATPNRADTTTTTYTFTGWTPTISPVTKNITYTAQYTSKTKAYTVTWLNYNGIQLEKDLNVPYGTTPSYDGSTPIKPYSNGVSYIFAGWAPKISPVTGDVTYTATYTETTNTYTVTWVDYNGTQLEKDLKVPYGATPSYDSATPNRTNTNTMTYTFAGWSPTVSPVTKNITYTAQYNEVPVTFTVTFVDFNETVLDVDIVTYGGDAAPPIDPSRDGYTFTGWNGSYANVTSDRTVIATYDPIGYEYIVRYVDTEGHELADPKYATADLGVEVMETAIDIEGYEPQLMEQSLVIGEEENEIIFVYDAVAVPLAGSAWALLNLLLTILTALMSVSLLVTYFRKKDEDEDVKRKGGLRIGSIIPAIIAIIVFILTEDMTNPMTIVDNWTILMVIIAAVQAVVMILAKRKTEQEVTPA